MDDETVMLLFFGLAAMAIVVYAYIMNKGESNCASKEKLSNNNNIQAKKNSDILEAKRFGNYDVVIDNNKLTLKRFVGVDKDVLEIPAKLSDMPVKSIDSIAFQNCRNIKRVIISDGIEEIKTGAFDGCDKLQEVLIPKSVKKIGENIFQLDENSNFKKNLRITIFCYGGSCALEYARKHDLEYRDAEKFDISMSSLDVEHGVQTETAKSENEEHIMQAKIDDSHFSDFALGTMLFGDDEEDAVEYDDMSEYDSGTDDILREMLDDELLGTGYDSCDLEWMEEEERNDFLLENGLDPDDYDFFD